MAAPYGAKAPQFDGARDASIGSDVLPVQMTNASTVIALVVDPTGRIF
jgi:hypothetical protein